MENASKALVIAAGVLVGIIILSIFAFEMVSISNTGKMYKEQIDMENVYEFNAVYTKYIATNCSAQDIISVLNYTFEWNQNNPDLITISRIDLLKSTKFNKKTITNITDKKKIDNAIGEDCITFILNNYGTEEFVFKLKIDNYDEDGRINAISITSAQNEKYEYKVTLNPNGGNLLQKSKVVKYNDKIRSFTNTNMATKSYI